MFKKMIYYFLFYATLGFVVSVLQQIVFQGFPVKIDSYFWEEWIGSSLYLFLFTSLQRIILRSFSSTFQQQQQIVPTLMKYFLILQALGFFLFLGYSILFTALVRMSFEIRLKDLSQLRFIFVYFFFIHAVVIITGIALRLYRLYAREKDEKHQAEKSFLSAQLQMLRQQLNPHFLFNNLNIIASTINSQPKVAYDFTRSMASFYRKVLETENADWITLEAELKNIQSYLYMLSIRFEEKLSYDIQIPAALQKEFFLPDFILQPIVENVIKHNTCSKTQPLTIQITLKKEGELVIRNNYQPSDSSAESIGIGWFNIESRYKYLGAEPPVKYLRDGWFYVVIPLVSSKQYTSMYDKDSHYRR